MIMLKDATCATGRASDTRRLGTRLAAHALTRRASHPIYRYTEIFAFLDAVDLCGKSIATKVQDHPDRRLFLPLARSSPPRSSHPQVQDHPDRPVDTEKCNVSYEARLIKKMYIRLQHA